jgi:ribonuclease BN (tRNA processing enzyme)
MLLTELFPDLGSTLRCFDYLAAEEVREGFVAQQNDWKVSCAPVKHAGGVCYRIDSAGKSLLYSGDTSPCQSLIKLGREADLAVLECSFPDPASLRGEHLYPTLAGNLASKMKAKKLVLTHLYPICEGREQEMLKEARRQFVGDILIAEDGMRIEI